MSRIKNKQSGFSMIEVLASLLVIGVGMMGLTGLQVASMKGAGNAHSRNIANLLAMDLSDRMRSNREGINGNFYDNDVSCDSTVAEVQCNSVTEYCTPQQTARFDVQEIMCGVSNGVTREGGIKHLLFSGSLQIESNTGCPNITDANKQRITISWSNKKLDADQQDSVVNQSLQICVLP